MKKVCYQYFFFQPKKKKWMWYYLSHNSFKQMEWNIHPKNKNKSMGYNLSWRKETTVPKIPLFFIFYFLFFYLTKKQSCECDIAWVIFYKLVKLWKCFWKILTLEDIFGLIFKCTEWNIHPKNKWKRELTNYIH